MATIAILSNLSEAYQKYLTPKQWTQIKHVLNQPATTPSIQELQQTMKDIIYKSYTNYAINKAYEFRKRHLKTMMRNHNQIIDAKEFAFYALKGLRKAINTYNTAYPFYNHGNIYIESELYTGFTELQPITSIPKYIRKRHINNNKSSKRTILIGDEETILDNNKIKMHAKTTIEENNDKESIIYEMNSFESPYREMFQWKFRDGLSNREIAMKVNYSEEWVRKEIKKRINEKMKEMF